jgi:hypothetical protein
MREQHFDLFAFTSRGYVGLRSGDPARHIASALVDRAWDLAGWHLRTTPWLEFADVAVPLAGAIVKRRSVIYLCSG